MIKIFINDGKLNVVDENNKLVGFDYNGQCCEDFGYLITRDFENESFTGEYGKPACKELSYVANDGDDIDECYYETFELTGGGQLIIYNIHNGYYSHGFKFLDNKDTLTEGGL